MPGVHPTARAHGAAPALSRVAFDASQPITNSTLYTAMISEILDILKRLDGVSENLSKADAERRRRAAVFLRQVGSALTALGSQTGTASEVQVARAELDEYAKRVPPLIEDLLGPVEAAAFSSNLKEIAAQSEIEAAVTLTVAGRMNALAAGIEVERTAKAKLLKIYGVALLILLLLAFFFKLFVGL